MSQVDIGVVERFLKAFQAGDIEAAFGLLHPEIVIHEGEGLPYAGEFVGHEGHAFIDAICTFEHEGLTGYCDLEVTNNARAGRGPITQCLHAVHQDGLSERTKP